MTLSGEEFLRRFVQHVLPKGFVKIRHYGLLANRHRDARLAVCRRLLAIATLRNRIRAGAPPTPSPPGSEDRIMGPVMADRFERICRHCGSRRIECRELPRMTPPLDSS